MPNPMVKSAKVGRVKVDKSSGGTAERYRLTWRFPTSPGEQSSQMISGYDHAVSRAEEIHDLLEQIENLREQVRRVAYRGGHA